MTGGDIMLEPKKLALVRILQILEKYSDCDHPLTHEMIAQRLAQDYGIEIERKAIGRNISLLKEAGFDIEFTNKKGSYLVCREFDDTELRLLIDGVLSSTHITAKHSKELIEKLCNLSNVYFRSHVKNIHSVNQWSKTDNSTIFYSISVIDEAIEKGLQVCFHYNKYGIDWKLHHTSQPQVSPYQLILRNQHYYLMAFSEKWKDLTFYRLDHITDIRLTDQKATPMNTIPGLEQGINYRRIATSLPYMFTDKVERIEFYADEAIVDQVVDWFRDNAQFERKDGRLKVAVNASPMAMEYWAMQYLNFVEIISPDSLRKQIKENLKNATKKYNETLIPEKKE